MIRGGGRPRWLMEAIAVWGYVQRNYFLTKRYFMWEVVWLVYITANALAITYIGAGASEFGSGIDTARLMTFLLVGALVWSYLSVLFDVLSETVSWERWEGTIEYTFMSPASRVTHLLGMGLYAVIYGVLQISVMLGAVSLFFELDLSRANYAGALLVLGVASVSLVGFGIMAAVLPLLSPEKGQQVSYIVSSLLLLVSGVYYDVGVLPGWMQFIARFSPVTYALEGIRAALLDGAGLAELRGSVGVLLAMGALFVPLGLLVFHLGERYAKRTGKLKRSG
ncbi:ABC-2 type transporter [Rubrobacter xylanophilus DSM 9941]|uniref:Transport permease protein n=1 Tax=Rubrobacter xylanophilus (strain DSM 9941 / JCM 11954 / NBRC 16129 / PRD-1) TaxID=266117 RepID=Q1AYZ7_RUBXD|nr:ABC transporter permease [Rubrobacter xylanophilus]ABG03381.1 ABC-2 type transporter [Rubrobacter xylanophilus DSM 9941]